MAESRFPYKWFLRDGYPAPGVEAHNLKVFGTFICGGVVLWAINWRATTISEEWSLTRI